jgi:hypothetical protein
MIYLTTDPEQIISIIPRKTLFPIGTTEELTYSLYNETTKQTITSDVSDIKETSDIFDVTISDFQLTDNTFYEFTLIGNLSKILYKDRIFCTDQTVTDFTINDGLYNSAQTNNNNYITI